MKKARLLLSTMIVILVASSISGAFAGNNIDTPSKVLPPLQPPKLLSAISIWSTSIGSASPQNSIPVIVTFNVSNQFNSGICGLDQSNFKLTTLTVPPYGPAVVLTSLTQLDLSRVPHICYYYIRIAPTTYQGTQYKWTKGTYNVRLDYIQNGQVAASNTFSFTV
jgi:hypothetical protein